MIETCPCTSAVPFTDQAAVTCYPDVELRVSLTAGGWDPWTWLQTCQSCPQLPPGGMNLSMVCRTPPQPSSNALHASCSQGQLSDFPHWCKPPSRLQWGQPQASAALLGPGTVRHLSSVICWVHACMHATSGAASARRLAAVMSLGSDRRAFRCRSGA